MNHTPAAVVLGLACATLPAAAQPGSITVYGSLDGGVDWVSNAGGRSEKAVNTGRRSPDRFGLRGLEDLGGGMSAFFRIENGFNTDTGTATRPTAFWNRNAQVGLQRAGVGSASFGHMPDFMYEYLAQHSNAQPGISGFFSPGNLDNLANRFQLDNALKFESADLAGFQFGAMAGLSETAGVRHNRAFGMQYRGPALRVSAAYSVAANRPVDVRGVFDLPSLLGQPIAAGAMFTARRQRSAGLGASYTLGLFTPHVLVTEVSLGNAAGSTSQRNVHAGVIVDASGGKRVDTLHVSYGRSTFLDRRFGQLNLFASHAFSRRTQVYGAVGHQRADNAAAALFGYAKASGDRQTVVRVGVQNTF